MKQIDSFLNKIMQLEVSDLEQSDKKECLPVIGKDPTPCPPAGGCESVSYHSTDFSKQRDYTNILVLCSSYKNIKRELDRLYISGTIINRKESIIVEGDRRFIYRTPEQFDQIMGIEINELIVEPDVELTAKQSSYLKSHVRPKVKQTDNDSNIAGYMSMMMAYYRNPELMLRILYG